SPRCGPLTTTSSATGPSLPCCSPTPAPSPAGPAGGPAAGAGYPARPGPAAGSMGAAPAQDGGDRAQEERQVQEQPAAGHVAQVELDLLGEGDQRAPAHLPQPGQPLLHQE